MLYGFGRIGRLLARILLERSSSPLGSGLNLRAVVVRKNGDKDLVKRASLLERDSVHGPFKGVIEVDEENSTIIANGVPVRFIYSSDPTTVDYTEYGINERSAGGQHRPLARRSGPRAAPEPPRYFSCSADRSR